MEEIKMKANVIKNINSYSSAILLFSVLYILFIGVLLFLSDFTPINLKENLLIKKSIHIQNNNNPLDDKFFVPLSSKSNENSDQWLCLNSLNEINLENKMNQDLEKEKLLIRINRTEEKLNVENGTDGTSNLKFKTVAANMNNYLIVEDEPELQVNTAVSINFPTDERFDLVLTRSNFQSNDVLTKLQNLVNQKTNEAIEYFEYQRKLKEYLTIETEQPMELEKWMTDEKCWCFDELHGAMAINLTIETPAIKR